MNHACSQYPSREALALFVPLNDRCQNLHALCGPVPNHNNLSNLHETNRYSAKFNFHKHTSRLIMAQFT